MRTAAIIVAGGSGARLKARKPKQFVEIEGRPLLAHTLAPFEASPLIDRIVLVLPGDQFEEYARWMEPWVSEA
ncbi:MAG: 2-C-methyl-D-erythritol 4-phosphate cytidylyltransferase, partial [Acidobacteriota bacterium]